MSISLNLSDAETALIAGWSAQKGLSISDAIRDAILERIEDELDLAEAERALADYLADPVTFTHDEVGRMLGL